MVFTHEGRGVVFFLPDEATKGCAGLEAGASGSPASTLRGLTADLSAKRNRVAPLSVAELRKVHEIERMFSGRISS